MSRRSVMILAVIIVPAIALVVQQQQQRVDEQLLTTYQQLQPAGGWFSFNGRPVDIALSDAGDTLWVKDNRGLRAIGVLGWQEAARIDVEGGASLTGLVATNGKVYFTNARNELYTFALQDGKIAKTQSVALPGPGGRGASFPCGIAIDGDTAYVCLSRNNAVAVVDLEQGKVVRQMETGVAPFDVALLPGGLLAVTNQGGRHPRTGEPTAPSAGTPVSVDERGIANSGTVSIIDPKTGGMVKEIGVGLQPSGVVATKDWLAVANANSDTVSFVSTRDWSVVKTLVVKTDPSLPFGSMPNALALGGDGTTMFVALAGNNALAIVDVKDPTRAVVKGFVPTGWYPGSVVARNGIVFVGNIKGVGSRARVREEAKGFNSHDHSGTVQKFTYPTAQELSAHSATVRRLDRVPSVLAMLERKGSSTKAPVVVPKQLGDPSQIEHAIYVIKENRTYDQVFGDIEKGSGEPSLCVFPRKVTPNQHAMAEQFVLLDNYYCEGVLSADGHSWATEGNVTPYLERAFGGFSRSYTFGDDPITYSSSGFIWDHLLGADLSFRNFGEMDDATTPAGWKVDKVWRSYQAGQSVQFGQRIEIERLRRYSSREYPGWNMGIPDVLRADRFLAEFKKMESLPNLTIIYLPQDHTAGTTPGYPTVASYVADNDLALGRIVEAVSRSKFWPRTVIFVNEDDPQAGFDHVDGHRSTCLVVSPYTRGGKVDSHFYNQNSVLHTILRIFGLPPMNQQNARAPIMFDCFNPKPNFAPFTALDPEVDMGEVNPPLSALSGEALKFARLSLAQNLGEPDRADEDEFNRVIWFAMKGSAPYPAEWAGAHGRGLKSRGLALGADDGDRP